MLPFVASDHANATPITPVTAASLPAWLEAHPGEREWLAATGFKAQPGTFAFVPAGARAPASVLA